MNVEIVPAIVGVAVLLLSACATESSAVTASTEITVSDATPGSDGQGLPDEASKVAFTSMVIDAGDGPELCLGGVEESLPPQCSGFVVDGLTMSPDWAETVSGVTFGERTVTVSWPAVDNRVTLLDDREFGPNRNGGGSDEFPRPDECADIVSGDAVDVEELSAWADGNPDKAGLAYFSTAEGSVDFQADTVEQAEIEGIGVLQVVEGYAQDASDELGASGRTPCIDEVAFSTEELQEAQQQITAAHHDDDGLHIAGSSSGTTKNRVEVIVAVADGSTVAKVEGLVENPAIITVVGLAEILE